MAPCLKRMLADRERQHPEKDVFTMKYARLSLLLVLCFLLTLLPTWAQSRRILIVVTSHGQLGTTGKNTGFYLSEVTHPYEVFSKAGFDVDFASPKGGAAPIDGLKNLDDLSKRLLHDPVFLEKMTHTFKPEQVDIASYQAIFYAGGHGTMWDFPENRAFQNLTTRLYESGGVIGAVCHGPAALVDIRLSNGKYLVDGQSVTGFTNSEEAAVGLTEVMPFLLESKMRERGARFESAANFQCKVAINKGLITGQNPASATAAAEAIVEQLLNKTD